MIAGSFSLGADGTADAWVLVPPNRAGRYVAMQGVVFGTEGGLSNPVGRGVAPVGTPIDLGRIVSIPVPATRVRYELDVQGEPTLADALAPILRS